MLKFHHLKIVLTKRASRFLSNDFHNVSSRFQTRCMVLLRQQPGPRTFFTPTALPPDSDAESPPKALGLQLLYRIAKMRHNAEERAQADQIRYQRHYKAQVREETRFCVVQLVYVRFSMLSTSAAQNMAIKAYSKLLPRGLGLYRVTCAT